MSTARSLVNQIQSWSVSQSIIHTIDGSIEKICFTLVLLTFYLERVQDRSYFIHRRYYSPAGGGTFR